MYNGSGDLFIILLPLLKLTSETIRFPGRTWLLNLERTAI